MITGIGVHDHLRRGRKAPVRIPVIVNDQSTRSMGMLVAAGRSCERVCCNIANHGSDGQVAETGSCQGQRLIGVVTSFG
jgi:hypothetical protein